MARIYSFYIIDREFGEEYYHNAYFANVHEALAFIAENLAVGNSLTIKAISFLPIECVDFERGEEL